MVLHGQSRLANSIASSGATVGANNYDASGATATDFTFQFRIKAPS